MRILTNYDLDKNQLMNAAIHVLGFPPLNPALGQVYFNSASKRLFVWNGTDWEGADSKDAQMTGGNIVDAINTSTATIMDKNLSIAARAAINAAHESHSVTDIEGLKGQLDGKVDNSKVRTPVPENAVFTDTKTVINGKTGVITKKDIEDLGIVSTDTVYSVFNMTTDGLVPKPGTENATDYLRQDGKWATPTDSVYELPLATTLKLGGVKIGLGLTGDHLGSVSITPDGHTHSIGKITGLQAELDAKETPVAAQNKATTAEENAKSYADVLVESVISSTPDTITTINGKTGVIRKEDIVALGIPAQDTKYTVFGTEVAGLVPQTTTSNATDYLRRDGKWAKPSGEAFVLKPASLTILGGIKASPSIDVDVAGVATVKLDGHKHTITGVTGLQAALNEKETPVAAQNKATTAESNAKTYTDTAIAGLVDSSPEALDTLYELAQALGNDPNFAATVTSQLSKKADIYKKEIGDGLLTSISIPHNLNSRDVTVVIRESAAPYSQVMTDVQMTTTNTITLKFAVAPKLNEYSVTIIG